MSRQKTEFERLIDLKARMKTFLEKEENIRYYVANAQR